MKNHSTVSFLLTLALLVSVFPPLYAQPSGAAPMQNIRKSVLGISNIPEWILPPYMGQESRVWVDSVFKTMSPDERIAQLIMVAAYSNRNKQFEDSISVLIKNYKIGGLVFFQGGPIRQAKLLNRYQAESKVPLLVAMDAEWGIAMRLDSTVRFPFQMALGAVPDEKLVYDMGAEIARHFKRLGMHVNFAPVVDVNNNPHNPVINFRSFGEDKFNVTRKAIAYMRGMQDNKILANAKHFPGHGDTDADSHYALPLINHYRGRLEDVELYPFKELIKEGLGSMMVAHLSIPAFDTTRNLPSTLSKPIVTDLLRKQLGFKGLVFTDAMNMKGVTEFFPAGEADMRALVAGNDVLEFTEDVPKAIAQIKMAIARGEITQKEIDERCKNMLLVKQWVGLNWYKPIKLENLYEDLNNPSAQYLSRSLTEASVTVLRNRQQILPLQRPDTLRIATLAIGTTTQTDFQRMVENYGPADHFYFSADSRIEELHALKQQLEPYDLVLVGLHQMTIRPATNFGITPEMVVLVRELVEAQKAVVSVFGNAYSLNTLKGVEQAPALIMAYQETSHTQEIAAQQIFGGAGAKGKLPVTVSPIFRARSGIDLAGGQRLAYALPASAGVDANTLARIDAIAQEAIAAGATPGCQVVVAKGGKVIYQKAFGYQTYAKEQPVSNQDLYDLASITKMTGSLLALMRLQDEGKFDVNQTLGHYLPEFRNTNKANLTFRDILTHQARLQAWIPFWKGTVRKSGSFKWYTFQNKPSRRFPVQVAENLYLHRNYADRIYREIQESPLNEKPGYVYSDLSFYLYPLLVKSITGMDFEQYLKETFYKPMGAHSLTFNPRQHFPLTQIVPTEYDSLFRKQLIHGYVHDEGAAMLGGVSGHAGLFGTANDVAKVMQLFLQNGKFGGKQYIKEETIREFTRCQFCPEGNRRGLGFDRPVSPPSPDGNTAMSASAASFGHTGFTGNIAWADPAQDVVYVFLSNRVHPTRENSKLGQMNIRTRIQQVIYDAIEAGSQEQKRVKTNE